MSGGINTTGVANTKDYFLGRGKVYAGSKHPTTGLPLELRFLGNAPEFSISVAIETLEHQSSQSGLKTTDVEVIISQKCTLNLSLDEVNFDNLAMFLSGTTSTYTNPAIAGVTETALTSVAYPAKKGVWYNLRKSDGSRLYDVEQANLTVKKNTNDTLGSGTTMTAGTDYTLDTKMGRIFIPSTSTIVVGTTPVISFVYTADAGAVSEDQVYGLTQTNPKFALQFIAANPNDSDHQTEYMFHQVSLKPNGDFGLISDDFTKMSFTGVAESDAVASPSSPVVTIRTHTNA